MKRAITIILLSLPHLTACADREIAGPTDSSSVAGIPEPAHADLDLASKRALLQADLRSLLDDIDTVDMPGLPNYEEFRLALEAPGYGGGYYDGGAFVIKLRADGDAAAARIAVEQRLGQTLTRASGSGVLPTFRFEDAEFDLRQLMEWRLAASFASNLIPEIRTIGTNIKENRIGIGLADLSRAELIREKLQGWGIPHNALQFEAVATIELDQDDYSLRSYATIIRGGIRVWSERTKWGGDPYPCTLGVLLKDNTGANYRWFTASHCTRSMEDPTGVVFHQPDPVNRIGYEIASPRFRPYAPGIPYKHICYRFEGCLESDVAIVQESSYRQTALGFAHIARPANKGTLLLGFGSPNTNFWITGDDSYQPINQEVHKVGAGSGWHSGVIVDPCRDVFVDDTGFGRRAVLTCQTIATYHAVGGDSGGPVFSPRFSGDPRDVSFRGIHAGRITDGVTLRAFFSGINQIRRSHWTGNGDDYGYLNGMRYYDLQQPPWNMIPAPPPPPPDPDPPCVDDPPFVLCPVKEG